MPEVGPGDAIPDSMQVCYRDWLLRVVGWDGVLPALVYATPVIAAQIAPNRRGVIEVLMVVLPITAVLVRFFSGCRIIDGNGCLAGLRKVQRLSFALAISILFLFDVFLILSQLLPNGMRLDPLESLQLWSIPAIVYLTLMSIAMYPGRRPSNGSNR